MSSSEMNRFAVTLFAPVPDLLLFSWNVLNRPTLKDKTSCGTGVSSGMCYEQTHANISANLDCWCFLFAPPQVSRRPKAPKYTYVPLGDLKTGSVVNVYGLVVFFKQPFKTRGTGQCEHRINDETWKHYSEAALSFIDCLLINQSEKQPFWCDEAAPPCSNSSDKMFKTSFLIMLNTKLLK